MSKLPMILLAAMWLGAPLLAGEPVDGSGQLSWSIDHLQPHWVGISASIRQNSPN